MPSARLACLQSSAVAAASYEGGELRCFANLFYCGQHLEVNHSALEEQSKLYAAGAAAQATAKDPQPGSKSELGAAAASAAATQAAPAAGDAVNPSALPHRELYGFGQAVVQRELLLHRKQAGAEAGPAKPLPTQAARRPEPGGTGGGGSEEEKEEGTRLGSSTAGVRRLSIVFLQRDSLGRQLLNMEELLSSCNEWQYRSRDGNRITEWRAACSKVGLGSCWRGWQSV